jgi:hypothetical protein
VCAQDIGDLGTADEAFRAAALSLEALGQTAASGVFLGLGGLVARERGQHGVAYAQLSAALDALGEDGERVFAALFLGHLAALEAGVGRDAEARAVWARLAAPRILAVEPTLRGALEILASQARVPAPSPPNGPVLPSVHARIALRCVSAVALAGAASQTLPLPAEALLLGPGATWFRPPGAGRVSLERRKPMALLLDALVTARLEAPGRAVSADELLAAEWPGEKVIATAGAHRVRVAVASLRKLGLRDVLQTIEPGYRLASDVVTIRLA